LIDGKKGQNLGGRTYLAGKLRERGLSRRQAARILNAVLAEMSGALQRDEEVEFPFGKLQRVKRDFSQSWELISDWPANRDLYTVEHRLDPAGWRLLAGEKESRPDPGWSLKSGWKRRHEGGK
jgi:hypothetical protein